MFVSELRRESIVPITRVHADGSVAKLVQPSKRVLRVSRQTGVIDLLNLRMLGQHRCERHRPALMSLHARAERLDAARHQPRIKRRAAQSRGSDRGHGLQVYES